MCEGKPPAVYLIKQYQFLPEAVVVVSHHEFLGLLVKTRMPNAVIHRVQGLQTRAYLLLDKLRINEA